MKANRIAVWFLELVTSPERAVTTVGDFAEESAERGRFWFWRQITQTLVAQVGREFASAPIRLLLCIPMSAAFYLVVMSLWILFLPIVYTPWEMLYYVFVAKPE